MCPPIFPFALTGREMDHLKQIMYPSVRIALPERSAETDFVKRACRLKSLDHHQEALARKFDGGHRILVGPSGSGKTLILAHKAAFLIQYNPKVRRILFVCYNIALVNYIRRLLAEHRVPMGANGVTVMHIFTSSAPGSLVSACSTRTRRPTTTI
jgi:superfamily II DNA or RNA helicase